MVCGGTPGRSDSRLASHRIHDDRGGCGRREWNPSLDLRAGPIGHEVEGTGIAVTANECQSAIHQRLAFDARRRQTSLERPHVYSPLDVRLERAQAIAPRFEIPQSRHITGQRVFK